MLQDLRFALRALLKAPGFLAVTLVPLALGIGASAAAFGILNAVLLRPLPYPEPDRLVILSGRGLTTDRFAAWQQRATSYDALAAIDPGLPMVDTVDGPERLHSLLVSRDFFSMLGLRASAGRLLDADDFRSDSSSLVVTDALAARLFGSPAAALGRELHLAGTGYYNERYQIVGTLRSIGPLADEDVSVLMPMLPLPRAELCPAVARLKPGVTIAAARAEAEGMAIGFAGTNRSRPDQRNVTVEGLKANVLGDSAVTVRLIFAAATWPSDSRWAHLESASCADSCGRVVSSRPPPPSRDCFSRRGPCASLSQLRPIACHGSPKRSRASPSSGSPSLRWA